MQDFSISQLDTFFQIHTISEKNQSFSSYIDPQFFLENSIPNIHSDLPYIYAGGTIRYGASTSFHIVGLPFFLLIYVTEGECRFRIHEQSLTLGKNSILFLGPNTKAQFDTLRAPFSYKLYLLGGSILDIYHKRLALNNNEDNDFFYLNDIHGDYIYSNLLQIDYLLKASIDDSTFYIVKFILDILTECIHNQVVLSSVQPDVPNYILRMLHIFEENYMDAITLDNLESEIGISKYRLCRDFSKHLNISPLQYLNQKRINAAKDLLKHSDMTIHAIGASVGIPNTNHFINLFKRDTGVTPQQFRSSYKHALL